MTAGIERVGKAQDWKRHLPVVGKAVERLKQLGDKWGGADEHLTQSMKDFMNGVNAGVTGVDDAFRNGNLSGAVEELSRLVKDTEPT